VSVKVIIAGSRTLADYSVVETAIRQSGFEITEVVSGTARGVDRLGERWAQAQRIPVKRFPADWARHGKSAGYRRNAQMAVYAEALVAVWDGASRGTGHMIKIASGRGMKVYVHLAAGG